VAPAWQAAPPQTPLARIAAITLHPSAILRTREAGEREDSFKSMVGDLELVVGELKARTHG
jgi:hypothetical protein